MQINFIPSLDKTETFFTVSVLKATAAAAEHTHKLFNVQKQRNIKRPRQVSHMHTEQESVIFIRCAVCMVYSHEYGVCRLHSAISLEYQVCAFLNDMAGTIAA